MSIAVATACKVYLGEYDVSGDHNKVTADDGATEVDIRVFGNTAGNLVAGLWNPKLSGSGFIQFGPGLVNDALRLKKGLANVPVTMSPIAGAAGDIAVSTLALEASYTPIGSKVGDALAFVWNAVAQGVPLIGGNIFVPAGAQTASGVSSILQLGAVGAGQRLYAALHVLSASGTAPTLDVTVKSAAAIGFAAPTTRLTFTTKTAAGADFLQLAGPITDQFWRMDFTIGGTGTPTFSFVGFVGIF